MVVLARVCGCASRNEKSINHGIRPLGSFDRVPAAE